MIIQWPFFSRKLLSREKKYATIEKECIAVKLGMEAFQGYLLARERVHHSNGPPDTEMADKIQI